jgi:hypothetical protein
MDKLDTLVTNQLIDRLLAPERLNAMLTSLLTSLAEQHAARSAEVNARVQALEASATEADERLGRLYALVETGHAELDDLLKGAGLLPSRRTGRRAGQPRNGHGVGAGARSSSTRHVLKPLVASCVSA